MHSVEIQEVLPMKKIFILISTILFLLFSNVSCRTFNITSSNNKIGMPPSMVIFTFDDGPNEKDNTTERLLDVLSKYDVKGVFCLLGVNVENSPEIVRRIYNDGHIIATHGYSDKLNYFMNDVDFRNNLLQGYRSITDILGYEIPRLYRPHGGIYSPSQKRIIEEEGFVIVNYTVGIMDAYTTYARKDRFIRRLIKRIEKQNGGIILLHDGGDNRFWIPDAVEIIIIALLERGFILNETFDFIIME